MEQKLPKIISFAFHPLLMPTYAFIIFLSSPLLVLNAPPKVDFLLVLMVHISTFILPLLISLLLLRRKVIGSIYMERKEDRVLPLAATAICFYASYQLLGKMQLSPIFYFFLLGSTLSVIIALITNIFWKISLHMLGIGGLTGTLLYLMFQYQADYRILLSIALLVSGLVGWARLKNNSHNQIQVYLSFIAGVVLIFLFFYFLEFRMG